MPIIGAHVKMAGGLHTAVERATDLGIQAIQIFGSSPLQWNAKLPTQSEIDRFRSAFKNAGLTHLFLHAAYLANLATADEKIYANSIRNLAEHMAIADALHATGLIFHVGSTSGRCSVDEGRSRVIHGMREVLKKSPGKVLLMMENGSGGGHKIGTEPSELRYLLEKTKNPRIKICLDTAHAFGAGLFDPTLWHGELGLEHLVAIHANDSKAAFGSMLDRHENLGRGEIGVAGFKPWIKNSLVRKLPWILEVPGYDNQGPDKKNVLQLKKIFARFAHQ